MSNPTENLNTKVKTVLSRKSGHDQNSDNRLLSFTLGVERFAIPLIGVREVLVVPEFTPLPFAPDYVLGVINIRGQIITAVDLRMRLNMIVSDLTSETALIVCESGAIRVAFLVDSINQVINYEPQDIQEKPEVETSSSSRFINAIYRRDNNFILIIDTEKILSAENFIDHNHTSSA